MPASRRRTRQPRMNRSSIDMGRMQGRYWWKSPHPRREKVTEWFVLEDEDTGLAVMVAGDWPGSQIEATIDDALTSS